VSKPCSGQEQRDHSLLKDKHVHSFSAVDVVWTSTQACFFELYENKFKKSTFDQNGTFKFYYDKFQKLVLCA